MALISVIVPVYNTEKYLKRCVDSILRQTFVDFELILVDDGSTDSSGLICDGYSLQDKRVHVIHQKNEGLSSARNSGIEWVFRNHNSEWISFIDSDDWIHTKYLEALFSAAQLKKSDVSLCKFKEVSHEELPDVNNISVKEYDTEAYFKDEHMSFIVSWGKLFKKDCFKIIRFPVGKIHEDEFVTYRILFQYPKIVVVNESLYAYFQNAEGIMRRPWTVERLDALDALEEQLCFFETEGKTDIVQFVYFRFKRLINVSREKLQNCNAINEEEKQKWLETINKKEDAVIERYQKYGWEQKPEVSQELIDIKATDTVRLQKSENELHSGEDRALAARHKNNNAMVKDSTIGKVIRTLKEHQFMFEELVKRDFKQKYKRTVLGMGWSILSPLLTLLVMRLVFTRFFGQKMEHYTIYLFAGNLMFSYFKEATNGGMQSLMYNAHIFTKINVPKYIFLFSKNVSAVVNFALTLLVFFIFVVIDRVPFHISMIGIAYPILTLTLFNVGVGLILSAMFVFFRDTQYLYDVFTLLLMYLSAIFYNVDAFSERVQRVFLLNPVYCNIKYVRVCVLDGHLPSLAFHGLLLFYGVAALLIGGLVYKKCNQKFLYYV